MTVSGLYHNSSSLEYPHKSMGFEDRRDVFRVRQLVLRTDADYATDTSVRSTVICNSVYIGAKRKVSGVLRTLQIYP